MVRGFLLTLRSGLNGLVRSFQERSEMAKRYSGSKSNLPSGEKITKVSKIGGAFTDGLDDTITGIDKQIKGDVSSIKKQKSNKA